MSKEPEDLVDKQDERQQTSANHPLSSPDSFLSQEIPPGVDRRTFLMQRRHRRYHGHPRSLALSTVKAWTAYAIASNEIASRHRVDLDATITAMAQTAKEMNSKYKETSEAGLAQSVTLC